MSYDRHVIYFIRPVGMPGPVRIGCSYMPAKRLGNLMMWSPFALEIVATIPGDFRLEKAIHRRLANSHSHSEWFHATQEVVDLVAKLAAGASLDDAIDLTTTNRHPRYRRPQPPVFIRGSH